MIPALLRAQFAAACLLAGLAVPASAQVAVTEFYANKGWTLVEQTDDGYFSQCLAKKLETESNTRLQLGRSLFGDDFVLVYGINDLISPGETEGKGRLLINGKEAYTYSGMGIYDSAAEPGSKYISIFLADGFIAKLASANSLVIEFARGKIKHGLKGSRDIIERLDPCMDSALAKENPGDTALKVPDGWLSGPADAGTYLAVELPQQADGAKRLIGLVPRGGSTFDIRLRGDAAEMGFPISPANGALRRFAASVSFSGAPAMSVIATIQGRNIDLPGLMPGNLQAIPSSGSLTITSLEPGDDLTITVNLTADVAAGVTALLGDGTSPMDIDNLAGKYLVRGRNPNGKYYYGDGEVSYLPGLIQLKWVWRNKTEMSGTASIDGNIVNAVVKDMADPVIYTVGKDGIWRGLWSRGQGTEIMVPKKR